MMIVGPKPLAAQGQRASNADAAPAPKVIATVHVGIQVEGLVVSPDSKFIYVANSFSGTVSVIDALTKRVRGTMHAGPKPEQLALSSDGSTLYVSNRVIPRKVTVIELNTGSRQFITGLGPQPNASALTPNGQRLWVANSGGNTIDVVDTNTNRVLAPITVQNNPDFISFDAGKGKAYVGCITSILDVNNRTHQTTTNPIPNLPLGMAIGGTSAYFIQFDTSNDIGNLSVLDTTTDTVTKTVQIGRRLVINLL
jgi:YVTN family beta-propeller protein